MPRVERAHRRHQSDDAAFRARLARLFLHPRNRSDGVQGVAAPASCRLSLARSWNGAHGLRAHRRGALAIEVHQVRKDRLRTELAQERCDLLFLIVSMTPKSTLCPHDA